MCRLRGLLETYVRHGGRRTSLITFKSKHNVIHTNPQPHVLSGDRRLPCKKRRARLAVLHGQRQVVMPAAETLPGGVAAWLRRIRVYRQMRMYDGQSMNHVLYGKQVRSLIL